MDGTVLVADDDRTIRTVLTQALTRAGCKVHATSSLTTLMRWIGEGMGDAVISDVVMPDGDGLEMLPKIAEDRPGLPVIVISAQSTVMTAIRAAEAEAWDYLPKPFDLPDLMSRTARALDSRRGTRAARARPAGARDAGLEEMPLIGQSAPMQDLFRAVARLINAELPVWIAGESGTGKTLIARVLHDLSERRGAPCLTLGTADLSADADGTAALLARAEGGTVIFDGIGHLDEAAQLRALALIDAASDLRPGARPALIATSQTRDVPQGLRGDLYYRLAGALIDVPPLRARRDDISLLATHFLYLSEEAGAPARRLSPAALDLMRAHHWPGNVRELEHAARRLALGSRAAQIAPAEIEALLAARSTAPAGTGAAQAAGSLSEAIAEHVQRYFDLHGDALPPDGLYARVLREMEDPLLRIALDAADGNQARCADLLGINRNTLRKKMMALDIEVTRRRKLM